MGNISAKDVGDTQQKVGEVGATVGVVMSTIIGVIMILFGIGLCIAAFIPLTMSEGTSKPCHDTSDCVGGDTCDHESGYCMKKAKKSKHYILLVPGIIFILLAILIMWGSRWWSNYAHHNRTAAQIGGTALEFDMLSNLFNR